MEVARRLPVHTTLLKAAAIRTVPHAKAMKDRRAKPTAPEAASDQARNIRRRPPAHPVALLTAPPSAPRIGAYRASAKERGRSCNVPTASGGTLVDDRACAQDMEDPKSRDAQRQ